MLELPTEDALAKKYPKLLQDFHGDATRTCMAWGLDCGQGWYPLLDKLFTDIEEVITQSKDIIPGHTLYARADQVKQKYGTLRFYYTLMVDPYLPLDNEKTAVNAIYKRIDVLIAEAEKLSAITCESCGSPGYRIGKGWFRVRCIVCAQGEHKL